MATLKVRVRAASGGPTMRVQVPWPFTVQALKDVISPLIMRPTSSFCLSLNKKAAIDEGPGTTSLSDLGVINGDLLFYISREGGDSSSAAAPPQPAADVPVCLYSIMFESINPKAFKLLFCSLFRKVFLYPSLDIPCNKPQTLNPLRIVSYIPKIFFSL
jgi:hypothetical protein